MIHDVNTMSTSTANRKTRPATDAGRVATRHPAGAARMALEEMPVALPARTLAAPAASLSLTCPKYWNRPQHVENYRETDSVLSADRHADNVDAIDVSNVFLQPTCRATRTWFAGALLGNGESTWEIAGVFGDRTGKGFEKQTEIASCRVSMRRSAGDSRRRAR